MKNVITSALVLGTLLVSGCSTKLQTKKEMGHLNLQVKAYEQEKATGLLIAIVAPEFQTNGKEDAKPAPANPYEALMRARGGNANYSFNTAFINSYQTQLKRAMKDNFSELMTKKGFKLKGPFETFDDLTYTDKKDVYLAVVPKLNISIEKKVHTRDVERLYLHEDGEIQVTGDLVIKVIEPLTQQTFVSKRINLSDLNIVEDYIYEKQTQVGGDGLVGMAMDKASAPDSLTDNTDVALSNAINKFYAEANNKIKRYLSREELLSFEKDVSALKTLKRF